MYSTGLLQKWAKVTKAMIHFLLLTVLTTRLCATTDNIRPHLIFMVADDYGWNDVGFRNPDIHSPNIDQLAYSGIILNRSYVQPICTPSRASFMTGYFPIHTGMQVNVIPLFGPYGLPTQFKLLPEALRELGYQTNMVGKWHLGACNDTYIPTSRGFDTYLGYLGGGEYHYVHGYDLSDSDLTVLSPNRTFVYDFWNQTSPAFGYYGIYSSIPFVQQVQYILESWDGQTPLFMYIPFQLTHSPQEVPYDFELWYPQITNPYRRTFSGMASALDNDVGQIINLFQQFGIYNNSIILFTADNGAQTQDGGNNYPLRGSKFTLWEGGTRATGFIHSPLLERTGYTYDGLIHAVDWYPTFVSLAGGQPDPDMDGVNVWDAIVTNSPSPRTQFVYNLDYTEGNLTGAIRVGDWKLILGKAGLPATQVLPEDVTGRYARTIGEDGNYLDVPGAPPFRLFNVTGDPTESNDVASENLDIVQELLAVVTEYRNSMVEALFQPDDAGLYRQRTSNLTYLNINWCPTIENVTLMPPVSVESIERLFL